MTRSLRFLALLCGLAIFAGAAQAQPGGTSTANRMHVVNACKQAAAEILQKIRPMLDGLPGAPKAKDLVLFRPDIAFSALARYDTKRIELTYGTCHEIFMLVQAIAYGSVLDPSSALQVEAYARQVASAYTKAIKQARNGDTLWVDVPQFPAWLGRDATISKAQAFAVDRMTEVLLFDGLAQLLGHELAHLALSHRVNLPLPDLRIQEAQADKLGLRLAQAVLKLPGNPMLLTPMFALMNREFPPKEDLESEHPHSACRIAYASQKLGLVDLPNRSDFPPLYKQYLASKLDEAQAKTGLKINSLSEIYDNVLQAPMCRCYLKDCEVTP